MARALVIFLGIVFIVFGIVGLFQTFLFGLFQVDGVLNLIHLLTGIVALTLGASSERASRWFSAFLFIVYGLFALFGFLSPTGTVAGLFDTNTAGNYLHLFAALLFLAAALVPLSMRERDTVVHRYPGDREVRTRTRIDRVVRT